MMIIVPRRVTGSFEMSALGGKYTRKRGRVTSRVPFELETKPNVLRKILSPPGVNEDSSGPAATNFNRQYLTRYIFRNKAEVNREADKNP